MTTTAGTTSKSAAHLADVVRENIRALREVRREADRARSFGERVADLVTGFAGSMKSVVLHAVFFGGWLVVNTGVVPGFVPFDPFPFVMLAMLASVEAIFLSTFVLVSQNRMAALADRRADLDLHVDLLAEHEVTRLIDLVDQVARKLGIEDPEDLDELKQDVRPEVVLAQIQRTDHER